MLSFCFEIGLEFTSRLQAWQINVLLNCSVSQPGLRVPRRLMVQRFIETCSFPCSFRQYWINFAVSIFTRWHLIDLEQLIHSTHTHTCHLPMYICGGMNVTSRSIDGGSTQLWGPQVVTSEFEFIHIIRLQVVPLFRIWNLFSFSFNKFIWSFHLYISKILEKTNSKLIALCSFDLCPSYELLPFLEYKKK